MKMAKIQDDVKSLLTVTRAGSFGLCSGTLPSELNLLSRGLIYRHNGRLFLTSEGEEYLNEQLNHPNFVLNPDSWKDEVLTGITSSGQETRIRNAALPTTNKRYSEPKDFSERLLEISREMESLAREYETSVSILKEMFHEGTFGWCKNGHWGMFSKSKGRVASRCKKCRAEYMRGKRAKLSGQ